MPAPPIPLNLSIGRACFVECKGCYNHFGRLPDGLEIDVIDKFLEEAWSSGAHKLTLCGGDPLSRTGIQDFIQRHASRGWQMKLDTVGTPFLGDAGTIFFGRSKVERIDPTVVAPYLISIGIPIDGASNESMAYFRGGRASILDEQIRILRCLDAVEASICVNTVVHARNVYELKKIYRLISAFKSVRQWQIFQYSPIGHLGYLNRDKYEIDDKLFHQVAEEINSGTLGSDIVIEAKSNRSRRGRYLLIDSDGFAWTPASDPRGDAGGAKRLVLGSIAQDSYRVICDRFRQVAVKEETAE